MKKTSDQRRGSYVPLAELAALWINHLVTDDRSDHTVRVYATSVREFIQFLADTGREEPSLSDVNPVTLLSFRNELQNKRALTPSTVNLRLAALRNFCAWMVEHGYLEHDPAARMRGVARQGTISPKALDDRQVNALLREAAKSRHPKRDYALVQVMLQTGIRISECAALEYRDVSFGERSGSITVRAGKGNKARVVPLNASARQALAVYVADDMEVEPSIAAVVLSWQGSDRPLWLSQKGGPLTVAAIRRVIDELVKSASSRGLLPGDASAHTLRHTFAMFYLRDNPGDLAGLATLLGHSSLDTTRIYGQPSAAMLASRVDQMSLNAYA